MIYSKNVWTFFTEQTILYCTNDFTEISFREKTNEIDGKWTIILRKNEINLFLND